MITTNMQFGQGLADSKSHAVWLGSAPTNKHTISISIGRKQKARSLEHILGTIFSADLGAPALNTIVNLGTLDPHG